MAPPPKLKLTYFDATGRAEPIRRALVYGGVPFDDERISGEAFMKRKMDGEFTFGSVPVMEVDGEMLAESDALLRYAGKLAGLYPEDILEAAKVDMVIDALGTMAAKIFVDNSEKARAEFVKTDIPRYTAPINEMYSRTDGGPFLFGAKMTIADIKLNSFVDFLQSGILDHIPTDSLDELASVVASDKAVSEEAKKNGGVDRSSHEEDIDIIDIEIEIEMEAWRIYLLPIAWCSRCPCYSRRASCPNFVSP